LLAAGLAGCGGGLIPPIRSEAERLTVARKLVEERHYGHAMDLLKGYIATNAGSADVDQAVYLLGECYFRMKDWAMAIGEFERLQRDYPESDSAGSAAFMIGEALFGQARPPDFDQEHTLRALDQWESYLRNYPGHWRNGEARMKMATARRRLAEKLLTTARFYLKQELLGPARIYFTKIEQEYGDTGLLGDAWLGLAQIDAKEGSRDQAIARLRNIENEFAGQPIAGKARRERQRLDH
jgi:outer membrane protein assembly factor BamD